MDFLNPYTSIDVSLIDLIRNLGIGLILAVAWATVISKTTRLVVDGSQYLPIFLLLIPSMILIISIIKSSIALSLGLVGALSIVRFRTPVKEPEELLYLFVAIAVGIGLGANQIIATLIGFVTICFGIIPLAFFGKSNMSYKSSFIEIFFPAREDDINIQEVERILSESNIKFKIKRINTSSDTMRLVLDVTNFDMLKFSKLQKDLKSLQPDVELIATENARIIT
jgi:hypothetical protein